MAIIIQNERIVDLSKMDVIEACIKYGSGEYELRAFENRQDNIGYYICDVPDRSEIPKILRFLAEIKQDNHLIMTPEEVITRYRDRDTKKLPTRRKVCEVDNSQVF